MCARQSMPPHLEWTVWYAAGDLVAAGAAPGPAPEAATKHCLSLTATAISRDWSGGGGAAPFRISAWMCRVSCAPPRGMERVPEARRKPSTRGITWVHPSPLSTTRPVRLAELVCQGERGKGGGVGALMVWRRCRAFLMDCSMCSSARRAEGWDSMGLGAAV